MFELEHLIELEHFKKTFDQAGTFQKTFDRARTFQKTFDRARTLDRKFDRAGTFTRTFDRGVVRRQNSDLKFCRRLFYYAAGKSELCMNFLLVERKNDDEFFISGEEKSTGAIFLFNSTFT